jgi:hypothetical protein
MFAQGDRVFPLDDLGGGVWSRVGTVVAVHDPSARARRAPDEDAVRVETSELAVVPPGRATVLWDDGSHEIIGEDHLCLVYGQEEPLGIRVVTVPMAPAVDVVQRGGQVVVLLREGLLPAEDVHLLRDKLRRVHAHVAPTPDNASPTDRRLRDLGLLRALIAQLTTGNP